MRQELVCTNCRITVHFDMDFDLDGNHEIACPKCSHIHYRVVTGGKITEVRYRSSQPTYYASNVTVTGTAYVDSQTTTATFYMSTSWLNTTGTS